MLPRRLPLLALCVFTLVVVTASPAAAYIDPGSGSYLIQLIFGSLLGAGVAVAAFWRRIVTFFGRVFGRSKER